MVYKKLVSLFCHMVCFWNIFAPIFCEDYCYMRDNNSYTNFATRTAYENIHGEDVYVIPECEVIYIWALIRHGTRYGYSEMHDAAKNMSIIRDQIVANHEIHKRGKLCDEDLQNLKNWTDNWTGKICKELTPQGVNDMKGIAGRLKSKLGRHFDFSQNEFEIQTTSIRRCQQSSIAFTNELFKTSYADLVGNNIKVNNQFLRIIEDLPSLHEELKKFLTSKYIEKVIDEVRNRLGYESQLSFEFIRNLYSYCNYESAWFVRSKPGFCAAFTTEHLKILEYQNDLYYFYGYGGGNQTAKKQACPIVHDLLTKLTSASNCSKNNLCEKGIFYFAHAETLLPTIAKLGLYKVEKPFLHDNYEFQSDRNWRSSWISPFASNLIVILYKCPDGFKIVFYHNENKIKFPGCAEKICSLEKFQELLSQRILKNCTQNCSTIRTATTPTLFSIWVMALSLRFFVE